MYRLIQICKTIKFGSQQCISLSNTFSARWENHESNLGPICGDAKCSFKTWPKTWSLCSLPASIVAKWLPPSTPLCCHYSRLAEGVRKSKLPKPKRHLHGALSMTKGKQNKCNTRPTHCCPKTAFYMSCRRCTKSSAIKKVCPAPSYSEYARCVDDKRGYPHFY